ncbi:MAG TPA: response regulator [Thermoanaerobaculia bacterium]|nr:response regulator [Thermoanaerobaculia bacterium]
MAKPRVLVVEDDSDLRRLYAIGLNQRGFQVRLAANGAEAIDRVDRERPDLILLDMMMPLMSGWDVLEKINPPTSTSPIPVIVISGQPGEHETPPSVRAWLGKPVTLDELVKSISEQL